jgi:chitinase
MEAATKSCNRPKNMQLKAIFKIFKTDILLLIAFLFLGHTVNATQIHTHTILMTFWSDDTSKYVSYPIPGSLNQGGALEQNERLLQQLDAINVLAYAFLQVDGSGHVYFSRPSIDLSRSDVQYFCLKQPSSCPNAATAWSGSFSAFARLGNMDHRLQKVISIGGAGSQKTFENAIHHPATFIQSATDLIHAYHLNGIDLDFEPDAFFDLHEGQAYAQLVLGLRSALGKQAFISIEVPGDWETLRSIDCPTNNTCNNNLGTIADKAYVSLMGYDFHGPYYPGTVTGNDSNLYTDPDEPLLPDFYHISDNQAIGYMTSNNVPANKIILGFPAYFRSYGGVEASSGSYGLYLPFDKSKTSTYDLSTKGNGSYQVARKLLESGFTQHYLKVNNKISAVYAYNKLSKQWISYEDQSSVDAKAKYVLTRHLAGMMMWEIGEDMPINSSTSLLRSAHSVLFSVR